MSPVAANPAPHAMRTTIYAVASPPGAGARSVIRVSGPQARAAVALLFATPIPTVRSQFEGRLRVRGREVAALSLFMPGPHSYTGEDIVELHVIGSPLLLLEIHAVFAAHGAALRLVAAAPGEFTRRAYANGRIDLAQAEGVLLMIHGEAESARRLGLQWLQGGLSECVARIRAQLQDALSLVEAGLDFTDGETGAVPEILWREPLARAIAEVEVCLAAMPNTLPGGEVLLLGAANAGKSSLCNALVVCDALLVDAVPGTTRDLVRVELAAGVAVWDAPGDLALPSELDQAALLLRDRLGSRAIAAALVIDPALPHVPNTTLPWLCVIQTKADRSEEACPLPVALRALPRFLVSVVTNAGIAELRNFLVARGSARHRAACAPLRELLANVLLGAKRAADSPAGVAGELVGADLDTALRELGGIDGTHAPDDLLDRIFGRFCLGK
ncbi:MAG: hypothetical protein EXS02_04055 [Planctomycetes bacterium]|nr:hypothetical protein [Planctomycetota bacterium]